MIGMSGSRPTDLCPAGKRVTRRQLIMGGTTAIIGTIVGCVSPSASPDVNDGRSLANHREEIIKDYASGRAARRMASERWAAGRDAWQLNYFGEAVVAWGIASERFLEGSREFDSAARSCQAVGATRSEYVCADAKDYCAKMGEAAQAYSAAAADYESGRLDAGEADREEGWSHYLAALDHEIRGPDDLEATLRADTRE